MLPLPRNSTPLTRLLAVEFWIVLLSPLQKMPMPTGPGPLPDTSTPSIRFPLLPFSDIPLAAPERSILMIETPEWPAMDIISDASGARILYPCPSIVIPSDPTVRTVPVNPVQSKSAVRVTSAVIMSPQLGFAALA